MLLELKELLQRRGFANTKNLIFKKLNEEKDQCEVESQSMILKDWQLMNISNLLLLIIDPRNLKFKRSA